MFGAGNRGRAVAEIEIVRLFIVQAIAQLGPAFTARWRNTNAPSYCLKNHDRACPCNARASGSSWSRSIASAADRAATRQSRHRDRRTTPDLYGKCATAPRKRRARRHDVALDRELQQAAGTGERGVIKTIQQIEGLQHQVIRIPTVRGFAHHPAQFRLPYLRRYRRHDAGCDLVLQREKIARVVVAIGMKHTLNASQSSAAILNLPWSQRTVPRST